MTTNLVIHLPYATAAEEADMSLALSEVFPEYLEASEQAFGIPGDRSWAEEEQSTYEFELALEQLERVWGLWEEPDAEEPVLSAPKTLVVKENDVWAAAHWRLGDEYEICWGLANPEDNPFKKATLPRREAVRFALQAKTALKLLFLDLSDLGITQVICTPARPELERLYKRFGFVHADGTDSLLVGNVESVLDRLCRS